MSLLYDGIFTEEEELFHKISLQKFKKWIKTGRIYVFEQTEGANNYGKYLFHQAYFPAEKRFFCFYPKMGFNLIAESYEDSSFVAYHASHPNWDNLPFIPKNQVLSTLEKFHAKIKAQIPLEKKENATNNLFQHLSSLSDEDGAFTLMQDFNLL